MLRFNRSLELAWCTKESLFSKEFCKGLLFATAFHILLFVVFRIAPSPNFDNLRPLSPVHVEIDLGEREIAVALNTTPILHLPFEKLDSPSFLPAMTNITLPPLLNHNLHLKADFSELETIPFKPHEGI